MNETAGASQLMQAHRQHPAGTKYAPYVFVSPIANSSQMSVDLPCLNKNSFMRIF